MSVVGLNSVIGYFTESHAEDTINALNNMVVPNAIVIRDGRLLTIGCADVTPGDLLILRPGTFVSADARIVDSRHSIMQVWTLS